MATGLTADQEAAVVRFVEIASARRADNPETLAETPEIDRPTAIRFLLARKFDVARALALHQQHEITRAREGLKKLDPSSEPLRTELGTGKFTILPSRDAMGAAIAVFTAHLHCPQASTHQTTLQGVVYQLDVALQSIDTQRAGLVFIYDMSDSKYSNFDYDLSQKILMLLKGGYPAKLKKVLIVTAPLWFKAPFKILRLFVREKLRERVFTVSVPQLTQHVPRASLPKSLGGPLQVDHATWLLQCFKTIKFCNGPAGTNAIPKLSAVTANGILGSQQASHGEGGRSNMSSDLDCDLDDRIKPTAGAVQQTLPNGDVNMYIANTLDKKQLNNASTIDPVNKQKTTGSGDEEDMKISPAVHTWCSDASSQCGSASSGFSDDDNLPSGGLALTPAQLLQRVGSLGRRGIEIEYNEIKARPPDGTFTYTKLVSNLPKNRYNDVLCLDQTRVLLSQLDENDPCSDYINANYVDGYKQKNAFISTQGPLPNTYGDFWRMVWEQHSLVIVMTTAIVEQGRPKCGQYWPPTPGSKCVHNGFSITNESVVANPDYRVSELLVKNLQTDETRPVSHWQFVRWPDYGVPGSAGAVLRFLEGVRERQARGLTWLGDSWAGHARGPPIIVHCSAGIGRTGTFCTLDICISRLEDIGTVDIKGTVERIRSQRAYSIQMPDQYVFCHLAVIEYALERGYLQSVDLTNFNDITGDDSD